MEILRTIALYTQGKHMPFLVIGGHAINAYGLSRHTGDLDLLVPFNTKPAWISLMSQLRYKVGQDTDQFARFRPDTIAAWPIDLMFVEPNTFDKMLSDATQVEFGMVQVPVVSLRHLVALKIHAMKVPQEHRDAKDFSDLLFLLKKSEMRKEELFALCERYASVELFDRLMGALKNVQTSS